MFLKLWETVGDELKQLRDEGRDVSGLESLAEAVRAEPDPGVRERLAHIFYESASKRGVAAGYPYIEPSDYDSILRARPRKRFAERRADGDPDKIYGAWLGRCAGCLLGKPVEGKTRGEIVGMAKESGNYPVRRYFEDGVREMPNDDDTDYTMAALYTVERFGRGFTSADVAEVWTSLIPAAAVFTAERAAYRNILCGADASAAARAYNPWREWIGAQIRADLYGYICPGDPEEAAGLAYKDAALSHVKNGIYGAMFVAAMLAAAAVTRDVDGIIDAGLGEIPEKCRLSAGIRAVREKFAGTDDYNDVIEYIHSEYDERDPHRRVHVIPNAEIVVTALHYGKADPAKTISIAVEAAFDTDCNGATSGSVAGMICGAGRLPRSFAAPLGDTIRSQMAGFDRSSIRDLAERTLKLVPRRI